MLDFKRGGGRNISTALPVVPNDDVSSGGGGGLFGGFEGFGDMTDREKIALASGIGEQLKGLFGDPVLETDIMTAPFVGEKEGKLKEVTKKVDPASLIDKILLARERRQQRAEEREARSRILRGQGDFWQNVNRRLEQTK
jgi:hypothetical protein